MKFMKSYSKDEIFTQVLEIRKPYETHYITDVPYKTIENWIKVCKIFGYHYHFTSDSNSDTYG